MALAIQMVSVAESLSMAEKLGLDPKIMANIMVNASSRCWSIDQYSPLAGFLDKTLPADNNYDGGFSNELLIKDLTIAMAAAKSCGAKVELGYRSYEIY